MTGSSSMYFQAQMSTWIWSPSTAPHDSQPENIKTHGDHSRACKQRSDLERAPPLNKHTVRPRSKRRPVPTFLVGIVEGPLAGRGGGFLFALWLRVHLHLRNVARVQEVTPEQRLTGAGRRRKASQSNDLDLPGGRRGGDKRLTVFTRSSNPFVTSKCELGDPLPSWQVYPSLYTRKTAPFPVFTAHLGGVRPYRNVELQVHGGQRLPAAAHFGDCLQAEVVNVAFCTGLHTQRSGVSMKRVLLFSHRLYHTSVQLYVYINCRSNVQ